MSAIAGVVGSIGNGRAESDCRAILAELLRFGPDNQNFERLGQACFGRALFRTLPEDRFDRQPLTAAERFLITLDCRIDNRSELAAAVGISSARLSSLSDADLVAVSWERWQLGAFDYILGDVAIAVWDEPRRTLTLARSPMSAKPLFYSRRAGAIAFASMPQALFAVPWLTKRPDFAEAAATAAGFPSLGTATMFEGVQMVRHGSAVELTAEEERHRALWDPRATPALATLDDYADAMRAELDRSVEAQMRRIDGPVACHLSSGRDSSAVATAAALALQHEDQKLIALTGAPSENFQSELPPNRIADESPLASATASFHPNIQHVICRSRRRAIARELRETTRVHWRPVTHLTAHAWTSEVDEQASAQGARILLIGSAGNFTLSPSGPPHLVDVLREQGLAHWWRQAIGIAGFSGGRWLSAFSSSLGPFAPERSYRTALALAGRTRAAAPAVPVLRAPYRAIGEAVLQGIYGDSRPPRSRRHFNRSMLLRRESADKMSLVLSGLDVRDPTADRRLAELALSIPADLLLSAPGAPSPVYERAFRSRLPPDVLNNRRRGIQGADWHRTLPREETLALMRQLGGNPVVDEFFDLDYVEQTLRNWPPPDAGVLTSDGDLLEALTAVAVADFLDLHFPR